MAKQTQSGGVKIDSTSTNVGNDVVGRDKIETTSTVNNQGIVIGLIAVVVVIAIVAIVAISAAPGPATQTPTNQLAANSCSLAGTLFNYDDNKPFPGVRIGYVPKGSNFTNEELFTYLGTSGSDGHFEIDCLSIPESQYPIVVALSDYGWGGCIKATDQPILPNRVVKNINLYVSDTAQSAFGTMFGIPKNDNCERK